MSLRWDRDQAKGVLEPRHLDHPPDGPVVTHDPEPVTASIEPPLQVQEDREPGGVDEQRLIQVEDYIHGLGPHQLVDLRGQFRRGEQVKLTLNGYRDDPAGTVLVHRELHGPPWPERFPQRLGRRIGHSYVAFRVAGFETGV